MPYTEITKRKWSELTLIGIDYINKLQSATSWDVILNFSSVPGTAALAYLNGYVYYKWKRKRSNPVLWQKTLIPTEKSKKQRDNTKNATKNFDFTTIADRLMTVSWGNDSRPTGVVKPVNGIPTLPLTTSIV